MNTGLHDVWNLVWKLDLSLHGQGNEHLLDSYNAERLPVIKNVIETTDLLTRVMGTPNKFAQALRGTVMPMISRLAPFQHAFVQKLSELGIAYRGSPLIEGSGKRYFDDSIRGGNGIKNRFVLLVNRDRESAVRKTAKQLCGSFDDIVEFRSSQHPGVTLIRPDGYIAYSAHQADTTAPVRSVISLLKQQTNLQ